MINELLQELRSYPAHYVAAHRAADVLERIDFYNCRLEDDLVKLEQAAEAMREHVSKQQLDIVTLGQEVGRLREALKHYAEDCDGTCCTDRYKDGYGCGYIARAALGEEK